MKKIFKVILILPLVFISNILCQNIDENNIPGSFINRQDYGSGISPSDVAFSPLTPQGKLFAAVSNFGDFGNNNGSLATYSVNNGFLSYLNFPVSVGENPSSIAFSSLVDSNKLFAAVVNFLSESVFIYSIDIDTGEFKQIANYNAGRFPYSVSFMPVTSKNKLFFAVVNEGASTGEDGLSVYSIDLNTNTVSLPVNYQTGKIPFAVSFSPITKDGNVFAGVANYGSNTVSFYQVDANTGIFKFIYESPVGRNPNSIAFSPITENNKLFVAVTNYRSNTVSVYDVNVENGKFNLLFSPSTGAYPLSVAFSPIISNNELFAAVANHSSNNVSVYNVDIDNGNFKFVGNYRTGDIPFSVAFSPITSNGKLFAATANAGSANVSIFQVVLGS